MASRHPYDEVADEIVQWLTEEPAYFAEAMRGGHDAPFSAKTTEDQKLDYYRRQVFVVGPDGTPDFEKPNEAGRKMLIERLGIRGYTQVMAAVLPKRVASTMSTPETTPAPPPDIPGSY